MNALNRYALHLIVGLNFVLILALAALWIGPDGKVRNLQWQRPAPQTSDYASMLPELPSVVPANTGAFMAILERPLFTITRRPPPPPPPPKAVEAPPPDTLSTARLTGLYTGPGAGGIILNIGGKDRRVRIREQIEGWTLSAIDQQSATFSSGSSQRTLPLLKGKLSNFTGQTAAAIAPQPATAPVSQPPQTVTAPVAVPTAPSELSPPAQPAVPSNGAKPRSQPVFGGSIR